MLQPGGVFTLADIKIGGVLLASGGRLKRIRPLVFVVNAVQIQKVGNLYLLNGAQEFALEEFYNELQNKLTDLENYKNEGNMEDYAILAHALKTEARYVGCTVLGDMAYEHELAGKENNQEKINQKFEELKTESTRIYEVVKTYFGN